MIIAVAIQSKQTSIFYFQIVPDMISEVLILKCFWECMPPDQPTENVVPMHYTFINAYTKQPDHSKSRSGPDSFPMHSDSDNGPQPVIHVS